MHGDLGQGAREQALRAFRNGKVDVLVATDVAARGIDVADVTHVINWECPEDEKTYLHRIGRTGRAGNSGVAITLVDWDDLHRWKMIDQALGLPFEEPIETYSSSPHLYTGLGIPEGTKGRLPEGRAASARASTPRCIEDLGETGASAGKRATHTDKPRTDRPRSDKPRNDRPRTDAASDDAHPGEASTSSRPPRDRQRRRTRGGSTAEGAAAPAGESTAPASGSTTDGYGDRGGRDRDRGRRCASPPPPWRPWARAAPVRRAAPRAPARRRRATDPHRLQRLAAQRTTTTRVPMPAHR